MKATITGLGILVVLAIIAAIVMSGCAIMPVMSEQPPSPPAKHQLENVANWGIYGGAALIAVSIAWTVFATGYRKYGIGGIVAGAVTLVASTWLAVFIPMLLKTLMIASIVVLVLILIGCAVSLIAIVLNFQKIKAKFPKLWVKIKPDMTNQGKIASTFVSLIRGK